MRWSGPPAARESPHSWSQTEWMNQRLAANASTAKQKSYMYVVSVAGENITVLNSQFSHVSPQDDDCVPYKATEPPPPPPPPRRVRPSAGSGGETPGNPEKLQRGL